MSNWNQRSRGNYGVVQGGRDNSRGGDYSRGGGGNYEDKESSFQSYPNSGALFPVKQKRSDNSPDVTGNIVIAEEVLDYILRQAESGNEVKMDLSGWIRTSRSNMTFTSVKINIPYDVRMEQQGNPVYRQPSGRPQRTARDDRQDQPRPQSRSNYAQASGREDRPPQGRERDFNEKDAFKRGDRMPDFLRDDDDNEPPF